MSSNAVDLPSTPSNSTDPQVRLLQAMGFSAVRVSTEVVALTTKSSVNAKAAPLAKAA